MRWGGHIGYVVAPQFRRRTCCADNLGSIGVIGACGGVLDASSDGVRQYWIDIPDTET